MGASCYLTYPGPISLVAACIARCKEISMILRALRARVATEWELESVDPLGRAERDVRIRPATVR